MTDQRALAQEALEFLVIKAYVDMMYYEDYEETVKKLAKMFIEFFKERPELLEE